jgi:hypothetical protein
MQPDGSLRYDHIFSWLHIDVRQFDSGYLEDKYFCKTLMILMGKLFFKLQKTTVLKIPVNVLELILQL